MKQLILIERSELASLKSGATLNLTIAGQGVLIGLEGRKPLARVTSNPHPRKPPARAQRRRASNGWHCRESECKKLGPFKNQSEYMIHRRATHQQKVGGAAKKAR